MDLRKVYSTETGEGGVIELAGGMFEIDSFTYPGVRYKVHPNSYCKCPRGELSRTSLKVTDCVKHPVLARALAYARTRRSYGKFTGQFIDEDLFRMVKRIFSKTSKEHPADSARFAYEVATHHYATQEMQKLAIERHIRVLEDSEQRAA